MTVPPGAPPPYGQQPGPYGYPYGAAPPVRPPVRTWDVIVTIVLLVLDLVLSLLVSFAGLFLVMASDPCGARTCSTDLIGIGVLVAVALPWLFLVIGVVVGIVLLVRRRIAFWVPLVAAPLIVASWFIGAAIAAAGVPTS